MTWALIKLSWGVDTRHFRVRDAREGMNGTTLSPAVAQPRLNLTSAPSS